MRLLLTTVLMIVFMSTHAARYTCGYIDSLLTGRMGKTATRDVRRVSVPGTIDVVYKSFGKSVLDYTLHRAFLTRNRSLVSGISLNTAVEFLYCGRSYYIPANIHAFSHLKSLRPEQQIRIRLSYLTGPFNGKNQRIVFIELM